MEFTFVELLYVDAGQHSLIRTRDTFKPQHKRTQSFNCSWCWSVY